METLYGLGMIVGVLVALGIGFACFIKIIKWADK